MTYNAISLPTDDRERDMPLRSFDSPFLIMRRGLGGQNFCSLSVKKMSVSWRRCGDNVPVHGFLAVSII